MGNWQISGKVTGVRDYVGQTLNNQKFIQFVSTMSICTAMVLMGDSAFRIIFDDNTGVTGVTHLLLNVYAMILSVFMLSCEFSFSQNQGSVAGQRIVEYLPFLRTRYGRSIIYAVSGVILLMFNCTETLQEVAESVLLFCGIMYGMIAMQPDNPLDYRGFQRPQDNFLSRINAMGAQSFDQMAAQYISLSSSQYLENQMNSESQQMQDQVLSDVHGTGVIRGRDEEAKQSEREEQQLRIQSGASNTYQAPQDPQWGEQQSSQPLFGQQQQEFSQISSGHTQADTNPLVDQRSSHQSSSYELDKMPENESDGMDFNNNQ